MSNLRAAKKVKNLILGGHQRKWDVGDIRDVVYEMLEAYDKPTEDRGEVCNDPKCLCQPPKIKLEAGCRVSGTRGDALGVVVHVGRDGTVCVNRNHPVDGYNRICAIHATNLTVTEAATPEIGDSVIILRAGKQEPGMIVAQYESRRYRIHLADCVVTRPACDFTITYKAEWNNSHE